MLNIHILYFCTALLPPVHRYHPLLLALSSAMSTSLFSSTWGCGTKQNLCLCLPPSQFFTLSPGLSHFRLSGIAFYFFKTLLHPQVASSHLYLPAQLSICEVAHLCAQQVHKQHSSHRFATVFTSRKHCEMSSNAPKRAADMFLQSEPNQDLTERRCGCVADLHEQSGLANAFSRFPSDSPKYTN